MSSCPLRDDGWPQDGHADCFNEIEYLRARLDRAEAVVYAASVTYGPKEPAREALVAMAFALDSYAAFLGNRPDPSKAAV